MDQKQSGAVRKTGKQESGKTQSVSEAWIGSSHSRNREGNGLKLPLTAALVSNLCSSVYCSVFTTYTNRINNVKVELVDSISNNSNTNTSMHVETN